MIDPEFLSELGRFEAALDRTVDSVYQGRQQSAEIGEGQTFSDHRRYTPGDDIRLVDWKVLARTDELHIKRFQAERELTVHVLLDRSRSMDFGDRDAGEHKFEFGAKLGLGLAYLAAESGNDFRFVTFADELDRLDSNVSNRGEILRLVDRINETTPAGQAAFARDMETYAGTIDSRSLVVVVSDFLADPDEVETGLAAVGRNDTIAVRVVAPTERDLPTEGDTVFEDTEQRDRSLRTYFGGRLERTYRERFDSHLEDVAARCHRLGITHFRADTDTLFFDAFADLWLVQQADQAARRSSSNRR